MLKIKLYIVQKLDQVKQNIITSNFIIAGIKLNISRIKAPNTIGKTQ